MFFWLLLFFNICTFQALFCWFCSMMYFLFCLTINWRSEFKNSQNWIYAYMLEFQFVKNSKVLHCDICDIQKKRRVFSIGFSDLQFRETFDFFCLFYVHFEEYNKKSKKKNIHKKKDRKTNEQHTYIDTFRSKVFRTWE